MVGPPWPPRSHGHAAGTVRGDGPPGGPLPSTLAGNEPDEQRRHLLPPGRSRNRARRPPAGGASKPTSQRSPSASPGPARLWSGRAAIDPDAGVDLRVVEAITDRSGRSQEPGHHDCRQAVEVARQAPHRTNRAGLAALPAEEAPDHHRHQAWPNARNHDIMPSRAMAPEAERPLDASRRDAVGAEGRARSVNRWSGREERVTRHEPRVPANGTGRGQSLVARAPPPCPTSGSRGLPRLHRCAHLRHGRAATASRAGRARGMGAGPGFGCGATRRTKWKWSRPKRKCG
jgi:hypothetical protein